MTDEPNDNVLKPNFSRRKAANEALSTGMFDLFGRQNQNKSSTQTDVSRELLKSILASEDPILGIVEVVRNFVLALLWFGADPELILLRIGEAMESTAAHPVGVDAPDDDEKAALRKYGLLLE